MVSRAVVLVQQRDGEVGVRRQGGRVTGAEAVAAGAGRVGVVEVAYGSEGDPIERRGGEGVQGGLVGQEEGPVLLGVAGESISGVPSEPGRLDARPTQIRRTPGRPSTRARAAFGKNSVGSVPPSYTAAMTASCPAASSAIRAASVTSPATRPPGEPSVVPATRPPDVPATRLPGEPSVVRATGVTS